MPWRIVPAPSTATVAIRSAEKRVIARTIPRVPPGWRRAVDFPDMLAGLAGSWRGASDDDPRARDVGRRDPASRSRGVSLGARARAGAGPRARDRAERVDRADGAPRRGRAGRARAAGARDPAGA